MLDDYQRIEVITGAGRRRRWTTEEKLRIVDETLRSGESISIVARRHGVAPNLLYRWRRLMTEGGAVAVQADDAVTGNAELRRLEERMRELEQQLGRKTLEAEILKEALARARAKKTVARDVAAQGRFPVKAVAEALGVSRSNLVERLAEGAKPRRRYQKAQDAAVLPLVCRLVDARPTYGYRRITALLNRDLAADGLAAANHKRVYRLMKLHGLLLTKHSGQRPGRSHDGKVVVMRSDLRWCSVLQKTITAVRAETWEAINRTLLANARQEKLEDGRVVRLDSTVTAALMHEPSDSSLLWDAVRVTVGLLRQADALLDGSGRAWRDHCRAAKKRWRAIEFTRGRPQRVQLYRELIKLTRATLGYLQDAAAGLDPARSPAAASWQAKVCHYRPLVEQVIAQTERRVLAGEAVPAGDKLVSLFEPHADIIVKGRREVDYGHKLNLTTGRSGLILDLVIEAGNPADCERLLPMLDRHVAIWDAAPRQAAADGGYASRDNLAQAKARGVRDMAFHKKSGLRIEDMVRSRWIYRRLRNFRAGIEAGISCLKRAYGLARCTWRGLAHFKAYVWSSAVAYNLALLARLRSA